jgi:hypothetical protein
MLAGARRFFLFSVLGAMLAVGSAVRGQTVPGQTMQGQATGVAPSVTSMGFGGRFINGVPPSVTSFGPDGYGNNWSVLGNCCPNFFWPANPNLSLNSGHHHHHKKDKDNAPVVGVVEPAYIPYAAADAPGDNDNDNDDSVEDDPGAGAGPRNFDPAVRQARDPAATDRNLAAARPDPAELAAPVATQPSTVLIFKDGRRSDVLNYAIVGDTLFDFSPGRTHKIPLSDLDLPATHKANDDRGVDFQIPAGIGQ